MVLMRTCCCRVCSVRTACFVVAFYASIYFTGILLISTMSDDSDHFSTADTMVMLPTAMLAAMIALCVTGILSTFIFLIGLVKDCRWLLLPVILTLSATALIDFITVTALIARHLVASKKMEGTTAVLSLVDMTVLAPVNTLCVVCLVSQFQVLSEPPTDTATPAAGRSKDYCGQSICSGASSVIKSSVKPGDGGAPITV